MSDVGTEPLQVVGWEGVFGVLAMVCVLLPIVQHTPKDLTDGLHEDTWETLHVRPSSSMHLNGTLSANLATTCAA